MKNKITNKKTIDNFFYNLDLNSIEKDIKKSLREIDEGKGIEAKQAMDRIHKEVFGEDI